MHAYTHTHTHTHWNERQIGRQEEEKKDLINRIKIKRKKDFKVKSKERTLSQSSQHTHKHNPSDNDKVSPLPEAMRPRWHPYTHFPSHSFSLRWLCSGTLASPYRPFKSARGSDELVFPSSLYANAPVYELSSAWFVTACCSRGGTFVRSVFVCGVFLMWWRWSPEGRWTVGHLSSSGLDLSSGYQLFFPQLRCHDPLIMTIK